MCEYVQLTEDDHFLCIEANQLLNECLPGVESEPMVVATIDNNVIGVTSGIVIEQALEFDVAVMPQYRNQGIGTSLVNAILEVYQKLLEDDVVSVLNVRCVNDIMKRILENTGFVEDYATHNETIFIYR